jgi:hypothetical protein
MFGDRRGLLRAALNRQVGDHFSPEVSMRKAPFRERREIVFRWTIGHHRWAAIAALLALDGATEWKLFPHFAASLENLERDRRAGELPADVDAPAAHIATAAFHLGYTIFRETSSRDSGIPLDELDDRVMEIYHRMLDGIAHSKTPEST